MEAIGLIIVLITWSILIYLSPKWNLKYEIEKKKKLKIIRNESARGKHNLNQKRQKKKEAEKKIPKSKKKLSFLERGHHLEILEFALEIAQNIGDEKKSIILRKKIVELGGNPDDLDFKKVSPIRRLDEKYKNVEARKAKTHKWTKDGASKVNILLIEDDRDMRNLITNVLAKRGFNIFKAEDGIKGQALALQYSPDLILLDLMLPRVDGLTLCQRLRRDERTSNIPILMITALGGLKEKVTGFNSGADDYITKPFDFDELYVSIKVLLRRTNRAQLNSSHQQEILNYGPLTLVPERLEAIWFESPVRLTHLEFELLHCLLQRHGQTVSLALILKEVWGYKPDDDIETIRVLIRHLRTKFEPDPRKPIYIKTVYGAGYCLELPNGQEVDISK